MPTVSVNIPEKMKEKIEELSQENMYSNTSEYIRAAIRKQIQEDNGLTPEEEVRRYVMKNECRKCDPEKQHEENIEVPHESLVDELVKLCLG